MATTILQDARVFEVNTPTTIAKPTMLDNNKNVWSNVVLNCNTTTATIQVQLPSLASIGNTLDCEIIINKVDASANDVETIPFPLTKQWQSAILRPTSLKSWSIEYSA